MNLSDMENRYAFSFDTEHLGRIRLWAVHSTSSVSALTHERLDLRKASSRDFMLFLLSLSAAPENPENLRRKGDLLSKEQLTALSDAELENIAGQILKHHTYLWDDRNRPAGEPKPTNTPGKVAFEVKYEPADLPGSETESNADYLRRVIDAYILRINDAVRKSMNALAGSFSQINASALAALNAGIGDRIDHAMDLIRGSSFASDTHLKGLISQPILPARNPQHTTNDILGEMMGILSDQRQINIETANSIQQLTPLAEKWEAGAKQSARLTWLSIWIAFISAIAAILALILTYLAYKAMAPQ